MVENQAYLFLVFSLTGIIIGIIYDIFRVLRKSFKTSDIITYFEDILFWIITGILILYNIWFFNNGEIRIFMFLGILIGILIYILILSNITRKTLFLFFNILKKSINSIKFIFNPIILIITKLYKKILHIITKNIEKFNIKKGKVEKNGE